MLFWGQLNNAEMHIGLVMGLVCGALYSYVDIEEERVTEHTLQCCIFVISFTVIWDTTLNG